MRIMLFSSCVVRDALELAPDLQVVKHISQSAIGSAFAKYPCQLLSEKEIEKIGGNFLRRCVQQDLSKRAKQIMLENDYEAILIDYIDERFDLIIADGERASLSDAFRLADAKTWRGKSCLKMYGLRRLWWWRKGIKEIIAIADKKHIPIILSCIYPAIRDERGRFVFCKMRDTIKNYLWLFLLYRLTPKRIKKISIPHKLSKMADEHQWGGAILITIFLNIIIICIKLCAKLYTTLKIKYRWNNTPLLLNWRAVTRPVGFLPPERQRF